MKRAILVATTLCAFAANAQTKHPNDNTKPQKNKDEVTFYFRVGLGYAAVATGAISNYSGSDKMTTTARTFDMKRASFYAGANAEASMGALFGRHVGAEMRLYLGLANKKYTFVTEGYTTTNGLTYKERETITSKAVSPLTIIPSMVVQSGGEKVNLYTRMGIVVSPSQSISIKDDYVIVGGNFEGHANYLITTRTGLGFSGAIGASFKVNKSLSFWVEGNMMSLAPTFKELRLTSMTVNGTNQTANVAPRSKTTLYSLSGQDPQPIDQGLPRRDVTEAVPFSNAGLSVGFAMPI